MIAWFRTAVIGLVVGFILGLAVMGYLRKPKPAVHDQPHPQINLPGGAVVVEEKPTATLPKIKIVTKTVEVVREVKVEVKPDKPDCPPVTVTLDLIRNPDTTLRVVAKAEGGKILSAIDVPSEKETITVQPRQEKPLKWGAGLVYGRTGEGDTAKGGFIDRDFSIIRAGVEVTQNTYANVNRNGWEARVKVGFRF